MKGSCSCGAVTFEVADDATPMWVGVCHCESCRRAHAAPMVVIHGIKMADVTFELDEAKVGTYRRTEGPCPARHFCRACGGRVMNDNSTYGFYGVPAVNVPGLLEKFPAQVHVNYGEVYLRVKDGLPKFRVFPPLKPGEEPDMVPE